MVNRTIQLTPSTMDAKEWQRVTETASQKVTTVSLLQIRGTGGSIGFQRSSVV